MPQFSTRKNFAAPDFSSPPTSQNGVPNESTSKQDDGEKKKEFASLEPHSNRPPPPPVLS
jgi:hypothetical protein